MRLKPGDKVTLSGGKKYGTGYTPGTTDLTGVQAVVCDEPRERVGSVDGKVRGRVTVRPLIDSFDGPKGGLPLDVPVDRVRRNVSQGFFSRAGEAIDNGVRRIFVGGSSQAYRDGWDRVFGKSAEE